MAEIILIDRSDDNETVGSVYQDDARTAQLFQQFGFKHLPEKSSKGILVYVGNGNGNGVIIAGNESVSPNSDQGETVIYSTSGGSIQATIKLDSTGNVIVNNGVKSAVSHTELQTALTTFAAAINTSLSSKLDGGGTPGSVSVDISAAEVSTVKLP